MGRLFTQLRETDDTIVRTVRPLQVISQVGIIERKLAELLILVLEVGKDNSVRGTVIA
jgi:hypothetical protein